MSVSTPSRRAVITGVGPISCIGIGREAFWQGILNEKSGITRLTRLLRCGSQSPARCQLWHRSGGNFQCREGA